jgi:hypothetical protein
MATPISYLFGMVLAIIKTSIYFEDFPASHVTSCAISGSKGGGLRLGEMEVSGLVGHGAPDTLQDVETWGTRMGSSTFHVL